MKRVLSLVLALVLVLGMVPVFANDATPEAAFAALVEYGFVDGGTGGDPMLDQELTREQMAKVYATISGKGDDAEPFTGAVPYVDADEISDWAKGYVAYAYDAGWMVGDAGAMTFRPQDPVSGQELLALLLRILGDETAGVGARWVDVPADAAMAGLEIASLKEINRGEVFQTVLFAVSGVVGEDGMTIVQRLGLEEPPAPPVVDLKVDDVVAVNLGEVDVVFNNMIDEDTIDEDNFAVGTKTIDSVTLLEDGMTVRVAFLKGQLANQTAYTLTIDEIADVNGFVLEDIEEDFTANDFTAPVVENVTIKGNKKIDILFSEPVDKLTAQVLSNYKIDDKLFGAMVDVEGRMVSLTLSTRLAEGVHTISVNSNVVDFAGFKLVANNTQFAVAADTTAPAFASLVSATQQKVVITFTEPVESFTASALVGGAATLKANADDTTWTLTFAGNGLPIAGTEITIKDATDFYGNEADDIKISVVPTIDLVRPEVEGVEVKNQTTIKVSFTKDVAAATGSTLAAAFDMTDEDDDTVVVTAAYDVVDSKEVKSTVVLTGSFAAGKYTLEVTGLEDTTPLKNKMIPYASTVEVADLTKPTIVSAKVDAPTSAVAGAIYIEFSEKVDAATALDKANYSYTNGSSPVAVGSANTVTLLGDGKTVKITVPKLATGVVAPTTVTIMNVTDLAGNKVVSSVETLTAFNGGSINVATFAPKAVAKNKIEITVPNNINPVTVTASDFVVKNATGTIYVINAEYDGKTTITLTLSDNLTKDAMFAKDGVNYANSLYVVARNLENIYGVKVADFAPATELLVTPAVADKIVPEATKVASATYTSAATTTAVIVVELDENLKAATLASATAPSNVVLELNGKLAIAPTPVVVTYADKTATDAAKLTFTVTYTEDKALVGKAYSLKFYNADAYEDTAGNNLADFTFTGTFK